MKKQREKILLAGLFVLIFLVFINNGWGYGHHGWGPGHHGWGYYRYYEPVPVYPYYYHYAPLPYHPCYSLTLSVINVLPVADGKPYVMDVIYNGRLLYKAVPRGERRLLRMRSCAYSLDERMVTIDVKDSDGNFIGTVTRPFYVDASRAEVWNISFNDIQR
jgi:hypothetical protein